MASELVGEVAAVVFANEANGFGVVELAGEENDGPRASGPLAGLVPGQPVRLIGGWTSHDRYGPTFAATHYEPAQPRSTKGLAAFLGSERFPGVGPALSERLVAAFGLELGSVISDDPQQLARVRGVSAELANRIARNWRSAGALAALVARLSTAGIPLRAAQTWHRQHGDEAEPKLDSDPYTLLDVRGVSWAQVERLASSAGIDRRDQRRLIAGAVAAHRQSCGRQGHTMAERDELVEAARRLLGVSGRDASRAVTLAADCRALVEDGGGWYLPADLAAERGLASELRRLYLATAGARDNAPGASRVTAAAKSYRPDDVLTGEQVAAVQAALRSPVSVLTGGPGTGKTRTVVEVVRACEASDLNVALCAPTGRAAKRLEELTGRRASTVHRLLEAQPAASFDGQPAGGADDGSRFRFAYGAQRRLPHDLVVVDEWSMADTRLAHALAAAVDDGAHLLMVGDADQLPSVGPGAVLRDLLDPRLIGGGDQEPLVAANRLTVVQRQAAASRIVTLAHEINTGTVTAPRGRDGDVFAVPERAEAVAGRVAEIVAVRAPDYFGCEPADVQVLAPMYRGPCGVDRLNEILKHRLNPPAGRTAVAGFYEGDRVVQTRNDAELDVANGDIGEVSVADPIAHTLEVAFPQGSVTYDRARAADLRPGWCLTVHKGQGGEWPVVILVLHASHRAMLWRELVYTAVTRARTGLLLVGEPSLVTVAARRTGAGARLRRTGLTERLIAPHV